MPISGFQATGKIDDGGTGAAPGAAFTAFAGLMTLALPSREAGKFDGTELDQQSGGNPDPNERELPTGLIKNGPVKGELHYTKANYNRLNALLGQKNHTLSLTTPDDQSDSGNAVKLTGNFPGWVSKIDEVKFEKNTPVSIPFEYTIESKPTYS